MVFFMTDKKTKIFWIIVAVVFCGSIGFSYWRFVVARDFLIFVHEDCDPYQEACFVERCDPDAIVENDENWVCTGVEDEDASYYKIRQRKAANIATCDNTDDACDPFACKEDEEKCGIVYCLPYTATDEDECTDPDQFAILYPRDDEQEQMETGELFDESGEYDESSNANAGDDDMSDLVDHEGGNDQVADIEIDVVNALEQKE